jgi:hypothetical protein
MFPCMTISVVIGVRRMFGRLPCRLACRQHTSVACAIAAAATAMMLAAGAAEPPGLPPLARTKQRTFTIPFRLPKPQDPDADAAAERVVLQVSKDLGGTWEAAGEAAASATSFNYSAPVDGEYWFRLRAIDRKGRQRGGAGPDTRVLVDAAGPRLAGRVWKGADGEICCRFAASDDSIDTASLKVEYRGTADQGWKTVAAEGILARQAPAHLVGEEIWWAGEKVDAITVRISVADASGNRTVKQFAMEPSDPGVDQVALAAEVGVPPLPEQSPTPEVTVASAGTELPPAAPGGWTHESGAWSGGEPLARGTTPRGPQSVLVARPLSAAPPATADAIASPVTGGATTTGAGLEYRGRPLQLSKSRRFSWDYESPQQPADGRRLRVELWHTRDGGVTWQRTAVDEDGVSPVDVQLPAAGLYGFRLEIVADEPGSAGEGPRSGDAPDTWLGVDEESPRVEIQNAARDAAGDTIAIRYAAHDPLLAPRSVRLLYSPHAEGPWATIADHLENQGAHDWKPDRGVPTRVFVRIEATDAAGNVGAATSSEPIAVARTRFVGRLGGVRPVPPAAP